MTALREDMGKAGIPNVDPMGRRIDFHSFRKTFNTNLKRAGVRSAVIMKLMRVSDHRLIDHTYLDDNQIQTIDVIQKLST